MLGKGKEWLRKLHMLKEQKVTEKEKQFVQDHIDIMTYLVDCAEEVESNNVDLETELPDKPEVSG